MPGVYAGMGGTDQASQTGWLESRLFHAMNESTSYFRCLCRGSKV